MAKYYRSTHDFGKYTNRDISRIEHEMEFGKRKEYPFAPVTREQAIVTLSKNFGTRHYADYEHWLGKGQNICRQFVYTNKKGEKRTRGIYGKMLKRFNTRFGSIRIYEHQEYDDITRTIETWHYAVMVSTSGTIIGEFAKSVKLEYLDF